MILRLVPRANPHDVVEKLILAVLLQLWPYAAELMKNITPC